MRLLADERVRAIVRSLAAGPQRPSQLEQIPSLARSTLYLRLGELTGLGLMISRRISEFPLRMEYCLTPSGRTALANELLIDRHRRRRIVRGDTARESGLLDVLGLLAPVAHLTRGTRGICALEEAEVPEPTPAIQLWVSDGIVSLSREAVAAAPDVHIAAPPRAWDDALLGGETHGLRIAGDRPLAHATLAAMCDALSG